MGKTDSEFKLCYFSPHYKKEIHEQIIQLRKIKETHDIGYDIVNIMKNSQFGQNFHPDERHEKEIYETFFKPRARILNQRIGESIRKELRSNSGSYFITGVIAVTKNDKVEWYTHYTDKYKEFDAESVLRFLKSLSVNGNNMLDKIITTSLSMNKYESIILDNFISSGHLSGSFEREIRVGRRIFETGPDWKRATFDWRVY